jgi:hypothetical protein
MRPAARLAAIAVAALACATPASAELLIGLTDNGRGATWAPMDDVQVNWAVQWTQTVAAENVTIRALLASNVPPAGANWWVTTTIGPGTSAADVVASGTYLAPDGLVSRFDFNPLVRTTLGTGIDLAAGTYYLVLDGEAGPSGSTDWIGDSALFSTQDLASGFSVGGYYFAAPAPTFGPSGGFMPIIGDGQFVFELESFADTAVPEPAAWALMILGFGAVGAAIRRRRATTLGPA